MEQDVGDQTSLSGTRGASSLPLNDPRGGGGGSEGFVPRKDLKEVFVPRKPPQAAIFFQIGVAFFSKTLQNLLVESIFLKCFCDKISIIFQKFPPAAGRNP